jgi:CubicO group peptidase (beta-lactamase class C family)
MHISRLTLSLVLTAGCTASSSPPDSGADLAASQSGDPRVDAWLSFAADEIAKSGTPGVGLALVVDGRLTLATGVGVRRKGGTDPITEQTRFRVGSMTKMITAAALLSEVDQGMVDLGHPVSTYLPALRLQPPSDPSKVSPRQLLTHTAGLPDDYADQCATGPGSLAQYFGSHLYPLWAPPGAVWDYSNVGFAIAGWLVETVGGSQYESEVGRRVLKPAHMDLATFDTAAVAAADHAVGHLIDPASGMTYFVEPGDYDCAFLRPPGGLFAAASDYAHFAEALMSSGGTVLSAGSASAMQQPQADTHVGDLEEPHYGYGLLVGRYKGLPLVWHDGSVPGFLTVLVMIPDRRFAVVALSNLDSYHPMPIALKAVDLFLEPPNVPDPDLTTPPSQWGPYVGSYNDPFTFGRFSVGLSDGGVLSAAFDAGTVVLTQYGGDEFTYQTPNAPGDAIFWRYDGGVAQYFVSRDGIGARIDGGAGPSGVHRGDGGVPSPRHWTTDHLVQLRRAALARIHHGQPAEASQ